MSRPSVLILAVLGSAAAACGGHGQRERATPAVPATKAAAASSAGWDVSQWTIYGQNATSVVPGQAYGLLNNYNQKSIRYQKRDYGINLGWDDARTGRYVTFQRANGSTAPLTYGEPLALQVSGGGYVRYKERSYGINLDWSSSPVYEWELDGGTFGTPVRGDGDFAAVQSTGRSAYRVRLFNRTHGDYVLYGSRDYGINLKWYADEVNGGSYPALPFPGELRGPSGEPGQALIAGTAVKTEVFHGGTDDELDWHIFINLDPGTQTSLVNHLLAHSYAARCGRRLGGSCLPLKVEDLAQVWSEWMVMDGYENSRFDERFYSADVGTVLGLGRTAWSYSDDAGDDQNVTGATATPQDSKLINSRARVYMQGPLVNDSAHGIRIEIHPLDSVAYALDANGNPVTVAPTDPQWPAQKVTWRVAAFTNSTIHRIDGAEYVQKERTTTWWLALPRTTGPRAAAVPVQFRVQEAAPGFENYAVAHNVGGLDKERGTPSRYRDYGVTGSSFAIERDPVDGQTKLRVTVTMAKPDFWGGMFLRDYTISAAKPVAAPR